MLTGNNRPRHRKNKKEYLAPHCSACQRGFTFFEVMVTIVILTSGIVFVYKAFLLSLDYQQHLTFRLHALHIMDDRLASLQRIYYDTGEVPVSQSKERITAVLNNKPVAYMMDTEYKSVDDLNDILLVDLRLSWKENQRNSELKRSGYILTMPSK